MSRPLRFVQENTLVLVTQRAFQGRLLLRPSPELDERILGLLGKLQARHGLVLHACAFLSNHFHLLVSPGNAHALADFMRSFTAQLSFEVSRIHGWEGPVFPSRYTSNPISDEEAAQVQWLRYVLAHGSKEHLVERPVDWPGVHAAAALVSGAPLSGIWVDHSALCEARRRKQAPATDSSFRHRADVVLSPIPCWADVPTEAYRSRVRQLLEDIEAEARAELLRDGRRVLGAARILAQDPHQPVPQPEKRRCPWALAASKAAREVLVRAYRAFVEAFRTAADRLKEGRHDVPFPPWSFPPPLPRPTG